MKKNIKYEEIVDVPWNDDTLTQGKNPLGKVPILITNDNQYIFDSKVIVRYLDQIEPKPLIYPNDSKNQLYALTIETVSDGICDAIVLIRLETVRVKNLIIKQWIERQEKKIINGLQYLSRELDSKNFFIDNYFNIADISTYTCLEYLDIRFKELDWRKNFPNLDNYWKFHRSRESFALSKPGTQIIDPITY